MSLIKFFKWSDQLPENGICLLERCFQIMCFMEAKLIKELPGQGKMNYFIIPYFSPLGESRKTLWCGGGKLMCCRAVGLKQYCAQESLGISLNYSF